MNFSIFLDPTIKGQDKDFYLKAQNYIQLNNMNLVEDLTTDLAGFYLIFLAENSSIETGRLSGKNIIIKVKGINLDMFNLGIKENGEFEVGNFEEFINLFPLIEDHFFIEHCQKLEELGQSVHKNRKRILTKKALGEITEPDALFYEFEKQVLEQSSTFNNFFYDIDKVLRDLYDGKVRLVNWKDATGFEKNRIIDFGSSEVECNVLCWKEGINPIFIVNFIENIFKLRFRESDSLKKIKNWNEILSNVTVPFIFFDLNKIPIIYNKKFSNLNLSVSDCSDFRPGEIIETNNNKLKVLKIQGIDESTLCIFSKFENEDYGQADNDELGIITSSIAHELNNPLAGILAGLDVLLLDDFEKETRGELLAMKDGVSRARKLVRTFLGFSRNNAKEDVYKGNLNDSFVQAIELTRARLIESNLKLEYKFAGINPKSILIPEAFMTMTFYLLIGEMVTCVQRKTLVENQNNDRLLVFATFEKNKFKLQFPSFEQTFERSKNSRLYSYLLSSLRLVSSLGSNEIVFTWSESEN